jgi:hypothetical protein
MNVLSTDALLVQIDRLNAAVIVLDLSAGTLSSFQQLRQLLEKARCPIVVLGVSSAEPSLEHSTPIPPAD